MHQVIQLHLNRKVVANTISNRFHQGQVFDDQSVAVAYRRRRSVRRFVSNSSSSNSHQSAKPEVYEVPAVRPVDEFKLALRL